VDSFIQAMVTVGPFDNYRHSSDKAKRIVGQIRAIGGAHAVRTFLRVVLERTICLWESTREYQRLPPLCASYHGAQLQRIADDTDTTAEWLDLDDDLFCKEFGIVSLRLYAAGSNLVDYRCGVPRSIVFREGLGKAFGKTRFMLGLGGFKPFFQGHLHRFTLGAFNEEGRNDFYRCCAELHALHPDSLGMFCGSWYYDPALEKISPHLSHLRTTPLAAGGRIFPVGSSREAVSNATATSETRRRLYRQGKYLPRNYLIIWGREDLRAWVASHPRRSSIAPGSS